MKMLESEHQFVLKFSFWSAYKDSCNPTLHSISIHESQNLSLPHSWRYVAFEWLTDFMSINTKTKSCSVYLTQVPESLVFTVNGYLLCIFGL